MLNVITKTFENMKASHLLNKMALSGVATSLIGGAMLHWHAVYQHRRFHNPTFGQTTPVRP